MSRDRGARWILSQISLVLFYIVLVFLNFLTSPVEGLSLDKVHRLVDRLPAPRPQPAARPVREGAVREAAVSRCKVKIQILDGVLSELLGRDEDGVPLGVEAGGGAGVEGGHVEVDLLLVALLLRPRLRGPLHWRSRHPLRLEPPVYTGRLGASRLHGAITVVVGLYFGGEKVLVVLIVVTDAGAGVAGREVAKVWRFGRSPRADAELRELGGGTVRKEDAVISELNGVVTVGDVGGVCQPGVGGGGRGTVEPCPAPHL